MAVRLSPRPDTVFVWDGQEYDLSVPWVDVTGIVWRWTGRQTPTGEPLMRAAGGWTPRPLPDVYHDHGPLIPQLPPAPLDFGLGGAV